MVSSPACRARANHASTTARRHGASGCRGVCSASSAEDANVADSPAPSRCLSGISFESSSTATEHSSSHSGPASPRGQRQDYSEVVTGTPSETRSGLSMPKDRRSPCDVADAQSVISTLKDPGRKVPARRASGGSGQSSPLGSIPRGTTGGVHSPSDSRGHHPATGPLPVRRGRVAVPGVIALPPGSEPCKDAESPSGNPTAHT